MKSSVLLLLIASVLLAGCVSYIPVDGTPVRGNKFYQVKYKMMGAFFVGSVVERCVTQGPQIVCAEIPIEPQ